MVNRLQIVVLLWALIACQVASGQGNSRFMLLAGVGSGPSRVPVISVEPSLWAKPHKIATGLRIESMSRPFVERCNSAIVNIKHYPFDFQFEKMNFYWGLGIGGYRAVDEHIVLQKATIQGSQGFLLTSIDGVSILRSGFYPQVGFSFKHLFVSVEYNFIYRERLKTTNVFQGYTWSGTWTTPYYYRSENYLTLKIGISLFRLIRP